MNSSTLEDGQWDGQWDENWSGKWNTLERRSKKGLGTQNSEIGEGDSRLLGQGMQRVAELAMQ